MTYSVAHVLVYYSTNYRMEPAVLGWEKVEQIYWIDLQMACLVHLPNLPHRTVFCRSDEEKDRQTLSGEVICKL